MLPLRRGKYRALSEEVQGPHTYSAPESGLRLVSGRPPFNLIEDISARRSLLVDCLLYMELNAPGPVWECVKRGGGKESGANPVRAKERHEIGYLEPHLLKETRKRFYLFVFLVLGSRF